MNLNRYYRLSDEVAKSFGLTPRKSRRYTLTSEQESIYLERKPKRLFFDIETSPCIGYFWSPGYKVNIPHDNVIEEAKIICICYKWEGDDKVHSLKWDKGCDKKLVEKFAKIADKANEIVAHNGDRFDLPKLRTRAIYHRIPLTKYTSLDTLKKSRYNFKFPSNKLDAIAKYLKVGGKIETGGFGLWVRCMEGDKKALQQMVEYCSNDVVILEDVYQVIKNYVSVNTHHGDFRHECPSCGSSKGNHIKNRFTPTGIIKRGMRCLSCGQYYEISNRLYLDSISPIQG